MRSNLRFSFRQNEKRVNRVKHAWFDKFIRSPKSGTIRLTRVIFTMLVIGTIAVIISVSAKLIVASRDTGVFNVYPSSDDEAGDVRLNRTFILKDSIFQFPSIGWPLDDPKYDLNGFRLPVSENLENGMLIVHKYCSRKADCYISPSVMDLPQYGVRCSEFKEIFHELRHCEILSVKKVKSKKCTDMLLDEG